MKSILIPIDFSPTSFNAVWHAFNIAEKTDSQMIFVHSFRVRNEDIYLPGDLLNEILFDNYEEAKVVFKSKILSFLKYKCSEQKRLADVRMKFDLVYGSPVDCILERINYYDCGIIVMGTHGATNSRRKVFGTITSKVVKGSQKPVLVIPPQIAYKAFEQVVVASDYEEDYMEAIAETRKLFDYLPIHISLLHVNTANSLVQYLSALEFAEYEDATDLPCLTEHNPNVLDGIINYVKTNNVDLLVLLKTKKKSWLDVLLNRSISNKVVKHVNKPILICYPK